MDIPEMDTWPASWENCVQVRKQQLELDMEQQTFSKQIDGETVTDFIYWGAPKPLKTVTAAMKLKDAYSLEGKLWPT